MPEGEGGWADEQRWHVVAGDGPVLSPHSRAFRASSERSEGSRSMGVEMLRCAQQDSVPVSP